MTREHLKQLCLPTSAALLFLGLALIIGAFAFGVTIDITFIGGHEKSESIALVPKTQSLVYPTAGFGATLAVLGVALGVFAIGWLPSLQNNDKAMFQRYRLGLGYVVTLLSVLTLIAFAGLGANGYLDIVFPRPATETQTPGPTPSAAPSTGADTASSGLPRIESVPPTGASETASGKSASGVKGASVESDSAKNAKEALHSAIKQARHKSALDSIAHSALLLCSMAMAILGVLFSILDSMSKKVEENAEFSSDKFWSGVWYRTGESVLFAIVAFLSIRRMSPDGGNDFWLPLLSLFMGMFVKTAERLVFGFGTRTLEAAEAFLSLGGGGGGGGGAGGGGAGGGGAAGGGGGGGGPPGGPPPNQVGP